MRSPCQQFYSDKFEWILGQFHSELPSVIILEMYCGVRLLRALCERFKISVGGQCMLHWIRLMTSSNISRYNSRCCFIRTVSNFINCGSSVCSSSRMIFSESEPCDSLSASQSHNHHLMLLPVGSFPPSKAIKASLWGIARLEDICRKIHSLKMFKCDYF